MKRILPALFLLPALTASAQNPGPCTEIFISEYIEGSSNNKALELYNPTSDTVDLSEYSIFISFNGGTSTSTYLPVGMLAPSETFNIVNSLADPILLAQADDTVVLSAVGFNGDDAIQLKHNTTVIDAIGIVGVDPGTNWAVGTGATSENTLTRKASVHNGYTAWTGSGDTTWNVSPQNTFTFFGAHTKDACPLLPLKADFIFTTECLGNATDFTNTSTGGTGPFTYYWDFDDGNFSTAENPTNLYTSAGCYDVTLIVVGSDLEDDTVTLNVCVYPLDDPMVTTLDSVLCNDSFGMFLNADDTTGTWSGTYVSDMGNGDGFFSSGAIPAGTYNAVYTTAGTCPNSDTVVISIPTNPVAGFTYSVSGSTVDFMNTSTNASSYYWVFDTFATSTADDTSVTFPSSGSFNVCLEAYSDSGCVNSTCQTITITGLNELNKTDGFKIYPNPANQMITLSGLNTEFVHVSDASGKLMFTLKTNGKTHLLNISSLSPGLYWLTTGEQRERLIVIK